MRPQPPVRLPDGIVTPSTCAPTTPPSRGPGGAQRSAADLGPAGRRTGGRHRRPKERRRRSTYLAAALVGATGVGMLTSGSDATAQADDVVEVSTSVAAQLGREARQAEPTDADAALRFQEMAASRAERTAASDQAAADQAAADADVLAAQAAAARPLAVLPVSGAVLSSTFGYRWGTLHAGIDLAAPMDTPELAAMDGVVLEAGPASGFGLAVYIQHQNGDVTVYGHMDQILVQVGQQVRAGDTIALLGNRGQSTGPHLHFEVHLGGIDGVKVDPIPWLRERGVTV